VTKAPVKLSDLFRYYRHGLPHQMAAIVELEAALLKVAPDALNRDQPWFKTWSQAGKQHDYAPAVKLIKQFEGCHLEAYADPLHGWGVPTIGFGTTRYADGRAVKRGDKINVIEAEDLLDGEIARIAKHLSTVIPHWSGMLVTQQSALISFAYNLGANFYGKSGFETITARLRDKAWANVPAALKLYRNPGTSAEAGLLRRRTAEGALWSQNATKSPTQTAPTSPTATSVNLKVPYEYQLDNGPTGYRECFSSSCAMVARYWNKIAGDYEYNRIRRQFGDTTDPQAQLRTLKTLGLRATFEMEGTTAILENLLRSGLPTPVGWLHRGPVTAPSGGGHWTVVSGFTPTHFIHQDPNGEANTQNGGYLNSNKGANVAYSRSNWLRRWLVDGPASGWYLKIRPA
jgi:GH24 family phage-related lysozyme (muramidase)